MAAAPQGPAASPLEGPEAARAFFGLGTASEGSAAVAPYAAIRRRVIAARAAGELPAGTRLPPVRTLAAWLDLAPNTVAKAYKELEAAGVVEGRGRAGTFLRAVDATEQKALRAAQRYLGDLAALGYGPEEASALLSRARDHGD